MSLSDDSLLLSKKGTDVQPIEITEENFMAEAMEGSKKTPLLLEFSIADDSACDKLLASLKKIIAGTGGRVRLGQLNILENRTLARQLIQGGLPLDNVPLTALFAQGKIIDLFQGFQPAEVIHKFLEKALKTVGIALPSSKMLEDGQKALKENRPAEACAHFGEFLENNPDSAEAWGGLIRALLAMDEVESAREACQDVPEQLLEHSEIKGAKAALEIAEQKQKAVSELDLLQKDASNNPDKIESQINLAKALNAAGESEKAADLLLSFIASPKKEGESKLAKENLLHFMEAWGENDLTRRYRRKLSSLLFS